MGVPNTEYRDIDIKVLKKYIDKTNYGTPVYKNKTKITFCINMPIMHNDEGLAGGIHHCIATVEQTNDTRWRLYLKPSTYWANDFNNGQAETKVFDDLGAALLTVIEAIPTRVQDVGELAGKMLEVTKEYDGIKLSKNHSGLKQKLWVAGELR